MGKFTWKKLSGKLQRHSIAKRQACCNKERMLASTRWSKLPRYRTMFAIFAIEIWRSNHISQHIALLATIFRQTFQHWTILFGASVRNM